MGCAGNGRSTIARVLSKELDIPFISSASITRDVLIRDGYNYADDECVEKFLSLREEELIDKRIKIENEHESFITDRTVIDHYVYLYLSVEHYDNVYEIEKKCIEQIKKYTHLFYLTPSYDYRDNGVRTVNPYFQDMIDYILQGIIKKLNINAIVIEGANAKEIYKHFNLEV